MSLRLARCLLAASTVLVAAPAAAGGPGDPLQAQCSFQAVAVGPDRIEYVVQAVARATGAVASTRVECRLVATSWGQTVARAAAALPGPVVVAASSSQHFAFGAVVPCVSASAWLVDGSAMTLPERCG